MSYLIIYEDGDISLESDLQDGDLESSDDGLIDIIDVSARPITRYFSGCWVEIDSIKSGNDQ